MNEMRCRDAIHLAKKGIPSKKDKGQITVHIRGKVKFLRNKYSMGYLYYYRCFHKMDLFY